MHKFFIVITVLLSFSSYSFASNVSKADPYVMIEEAAQITFDRFAREETEIKKNPEILKDIVREELMPYISYKYASLKVLGSHAKKAQRADVLAFMEAFKEYLITSYAQVFTLYNKQQVIFEPDKKIDKQKIVFVGVDIIDGDRPPINIKFKVRKFAQKDSNGKFSHYDWEAFDLVAEGISLLDAKQKELRSILAQNGVVKVTEMLKEKSERKIVFSDAISVQGQLDAQDKN
ncbi:ABC transporter substrate-binding protein [Colwelliaceae bacterium BS250]